MDYNTVTTVPQPCDLRINLFQHQLASIYQMERLECEQLVEYDGGVKETRQGDGRDLDVNASA